MSLLGSIGGALKGAAAGFIAGGPAGAVVGAGAGLLATGAGKANVARGRGQGLQLAAQQQSSGMYSASPSARLASMPMYQAAVVNNQPVVTGGGGATGSWTPSGKLRYSHNVVDATTGRVYRVSNRTGKIIRPRQMNPLNGRAARRAIRRIKGARRMLQAIERALPKARTHRTTRAR
jgi:hypothetical protein